MYIPLPVKTMLATQVQLAKAGLAVSGSVDSIVDAAKSNAAAEAC